MKLVFMGTPEFALPTLQALIDSEHEIMAVYTQPPRPAGRGHQLQKTAIHEFAEKNNLEVRIPETLKDMQIQQNFYSLNADATIVAAYGLVLPTSILNACPHGCINIHPSLLPRWRGASPINRPIMEGDLETGVSIMKMDSGLDTGDVYMEEKFSIPSDYNAGMLHDELAEISSRLLIETLGRLEKGEIEARPQNDDEAIYAEKLTKDDGRILWNFPAQQVDALIRGVTPWPGAFFMLGDEKIKIIQAEWNEGKEYDKPGEVLDDSLTISCALGTIHPIRMQKSGKKEMYTEEFLRGTPIEVGTQLD